MENPAALKDRKERQRQERLAKSRATAAVSRYDTLHLLMRRLTEHLPTAGARPPPLGPTKTFFHHWAPSLLMPPEAHKPDCEALIPACESEEVFRDDSHSLQAHPPAWLCSKDCPHTPSCMATHETDLGALRLRWTWPRA